MKASPRLTLPAVLTAAVLAITTLTPVAATEQSDATTLSADRLGDLVSKVVESDGEVVSTLVDETTGESVLPDPGRAGDPPAGDGALGGAVLGQAGKSADHFERLAEASARAAAGIGGELPEPSASPDDGAPADGAGAAASAPGGSAAWAPAGIKGTDVSAWQTSLNWSSLWNQGSRFAYVKASEGDTYRNPLFSQQYSGAGAVGMYRGGYHFAIPTRNSSGARQADYFVDNGGGWSADGRTLPGLLDVENNPYPGLYGNQCYDFTPAQMVSWIRDFSNRYKARTGRLPAIYTNYYWWRDCTGNSTAFNDHPLHIASYGAAPQNPGGWSTYDLWQYTDAGFAERIDANVYRGNQAQLADLVRNRAYKPLGGRAPAGSPPAVSPSGFVVKGGIGSAYRALGGAAAFGAPTMNERGGLVGGGAYQNFAKSTAFYWSPRTGAWPVKYNGAIGDRWRATGHERGFGYPTMQERGGLVGGGAYQVFRDGASVHKMLWSPRTGAKVIKENSAIGNRWKNAGYERGYGYPATDEYRSGTEVRQDFSGGATVHWSSVTGRTWVTR